MEDDATVPPLRPALEWEAPPAGADGPWRLRDPRLGRSLKVDARGREIALLLDRVQSLDELLARVEAGGRPIAADALGRVLAAFDGLGLLDTDAAVRAMAEHRRMRDDFRDRRDALPLLVPDVLRFTCTACGSCCLGANIGPVTDDVTARLSGERHDELARAYGGRKGLFFSMVPDGETDEILVCETRNGACAFLDPDGLCGIHRRYGPEFKPRVCRLFPYQFVMTPAGIAVSLQLECRDVLAASQGRPLTEQAADIRELLALADEIPVTRPFVSLDGVTAVPFEAYDGIEAEACAAVDACEGGGFAMALASRGVVADRCAATGRPLPEAPSADVLRHDLWALLQDVGERLMRLKAEHRLDGQGVKLHTANLDLVLEALSDLPLFADVVLDSDEDGDGRGLARLGLRNAWRGKDFLLPPDLVTAIAMYGLRWLLVRAVAVSRCRQVHRRVPASRDLADAWVAVHMIMRNKRVLKTLADRRDDIVRLFAHHLDALVAMRNELVDVDKRTEFYLF
jgi:Fe-S-cluster containining protein